MNDNNHNETQPIEGDSVSSEASSTDDLKSKVIEVLRTCYDPEIPVDIYELGLVYNVNVDPSGNVVITMTLTSPGCPVAGTLPVEIEDKVMSIDGVNKARVDIVWDPPWTPDRMTEAARLTLGML
jgi:FeS assembly SUF system protein